MKDKSISTDKMTTDLGCVTSIDFFPDTVVWFISIEIILQLHGQRFVWHTVWAREVRVTAAHAIIAQYGPEKSGSRLHKQLQHIYIERTEKSESQLHTELLHAVSLRKRLLTK